MNSYKNAKYLPEIIGQKSIEVDINGNPSCVPVDPDNRHYAEIKQQVAPFSGGYSTALPFQAVTLS